MHIVTSFESIRNPVRAFAFYLAGKQLTQAQQIVRTVKQTHTTGAHLRDVLMGSLMQHAPDLALKFLVQYAFIEQWWNTNIAQVPVHILSVPAVLAT